MQKTKMIFVLLIGLSLIIPVSSNAGWNNKNPIDSSINPANPRTQIFPGSMSDVSIEAACMAASGICYRVAASQLTRCLNGVATTLSDGNGSGSGNTVSSCQNQYQAAIQICNDDYQDCISGN